MTLSEELQWRGFVNQTTFKNVAQLDDSPMTFYWGVDPSAPSMTIGNLAAAMMVKKFMKHGHRAILLVGGATGLIGDPDGKAEERTLKSQEEIDNNKQAIAGQYQQIFGDYEFQVVDNYDWFKDMGYLEFLRNVGKHVPMRQMMQRDFVQSRMGEEGAGISYAEFSYSLIQGYDFLHLFREFGVTLQVAASDQWGNSIAGVELIRRIAGGEAHVYTTPLIINKATGKKFGKSEEGAVWLDPNMTSPTQFYQFWINADDDGVEDYLKVFTDLSKGEIDAVMEAQISDKSARHAQIHLAREVTRIVHGQEMMETAELVTEYLTGKTSLEGIPAHALDALRTEIPSVGAASNGSILETMIAGGLATSISEARRLLSDSAVSLNGNKITREHFEPDDFHESRLLLKKGKKYKDSALVELETNE